MWTGDRPVSVKSKTKTTELVFRTKNTAGRLCDHWMETMEYPLENVDQDVKGCSGEKIDPTIY